MVQIDIAYQGELHCQAEHVPSRARLSTDAPVDNHGKGESFSPTDLVATALGTCMATIMAIVAGRHDIELKGMKIKVTKEMASQPVRRISRLHTEIWAPLNAASPFCDALARAAHACPVHQSLHPDIDKPIQFHWMG